MVILLGGLYLRTQLTYIIPRPVLNRSLENLSDRPIKKIKLWYQGSPVETQKQVIAQNVKRGKKLLFNEENRAQPSHEVSQKKMLVAIGGEDLTNRDLTDKE